MGLREEIENGTEDLAKLTDLRNECTQLDWYAKENGSRGGSRPASAFQMTPAPPKSAKRPARPKSAITPNMLKSSLPSHQHAINNPSPVITNRAFRLRSGSGFSSINRDSIYDQGYHLP